MKVRNKIRSEEEESGESAVKSKLRQRLQGEEANEVDLVRTPSDTNERDDRVVLLFNALA